MDIFKIIGVSITSVFLALAVKQERREMALLISLAAGIVIFFSVLQSLSEVVETFRGITEQSGIDSRYFSIALKITGISYCTRFAASVCRDAGETAVAEKVELAGKVVIMAMTAPVIKSFMALCAEGLGFG